MSDKGQKVRKGFKKDRNHPKIQKSAKDLGRLGGNQICYILPDFKSKGNLWIIYIFILHYNSK